jgi:hypothetical protein
VTQSVQLWAQINLLITLLSDTDILVKQEKRVKSISAFKLLMRIVPRKHCEIKILLVNFEFMLSHMYPTTGSAEFWKYFNLIKYFIFLVISTRTWFLTLGKRSRNEIWNNKKTFIIIIAISKIKPFKLLFKQYCISPSVLKLDIADGLSTIINWRRNNHKYQFLPKFLTISLNYNHHQSKLVLTKIVINSFDEILWGNFPIN